MTPPRERPRDNPEPVATGPGGAIHPRGRRMLAGRERAETDRRIDRPAPSAARAGIRGHERGRAPPDRLGSRLRRGSADRARRSADRRDRLNAGTGQLSAAHGRLGASAGWPAASTGARRVGGTRARPRLRPGHRRRPCDRPSVGLRLGGEHRYQRLDCRRHRGRSRLSSAAGIHHHRRHRSDRVPRVHRHPVVQPQRIRRVVQAGRRCNHEPGDARPRQPRRPLVRGPSRRELRGALRRGLRQRLRSPGPWPGALRRRSRGRFGGRPRGCTRRPSQRVRRAPHAARVHPGHHRRRSARPRRARRGAQGSPVRPRPLLRQPSSGHQPSSHQPFKPSASSSGRPARPGPISTSSTSTQPAAPG